MAAELWGYGPGSFVLVAQNFISILQLPEALFGLLESILVLVCRHTQLLEETSPREQVQFPTEVSTRGTSRYISLMAEPGCHSRAPRL